VRICSVGHDDLFKILVEGSNGAAIFWVSGWFIKRSVSGAEEKSGVMRLLV